MANTASPPTTHGVVAAATTSDPPEACAFAVASCMPCLSISCPADAATTAKMTSSKLPADK